MLLEFIPDRKTSLQTSPRRRCRAARILFDALEPRALLSGDTFTQTNLVSDGAVPAATIDPQLVNPWGMSFSSSSPFWISDNGTGLATLYDGAGVKQKLVVSIPGAGGMPSAPTGQFFNSTSDFMITSGTASAPAVFIFVGEDGGISGWNPKVDPTNAILMVDHSFDGAVFKGATLATVNGHSVLLAADFHNGRVDAFDGSFQEITDTSDFVDPRVPAGFAPFNVQNVGGNIFVTFAKQGPGAHDDVAGNGNGYVDEFTTDGSLVLSFQHGGFLNSPWGVTQAPADWGQFSGDILVGNFGSGHIAAFDPTTGHFDGFLRGDDHKKITIDGLWALNFGNGAHGSDPNTLYFTAGLNDEADGLFGSLTLNPKLKPKV